MGMRGLGMSERERGREKGMSGFGRSEIGCRQ